MFTLIDLPYAKDALEPVISAKTLEFHHGSKQSHCPWLDIQDRVGRWHPSGV